MSFNKLIMMGRLTRDVELKKVGGKDTSVCEFGLAVDSGWGDNATVCFVDVTCWGKQAEFTAKYFKKGSPIHLEGRLDYQTWEKDGQKRSKHRITAERVTFPIGSKKEEGGQDSGSSDSEKYKADEKELPF